MYHSLLMVAMWVGVKDDSGGLGRGGGCCAVAGAWTATQGPHCIVAVRSFARGKAV